MTRMKWMETAQRTNQMRLRKEKRKQKIIKIECHWLFEYIIIIKLNINRISFFSFTFLVISKSHILNYANFLTFSIHSIRLGSPQLLIISQLGDAAEPFKPPIRDFTLICSHPLYLCIPCRTAACVVVVPPTTQYQWLRLLLEMSGTETEHQRNTRLGGDSLEIFIEKIQTEEIPAHTWPSPKLLWAPTSLHH